MRVLGIWIIFLYCSRPPKFRPRVGRGHLSSTTRGRNFALAGPDSFFVLLNPHSEKGAEEEHQQGRRRDWGHSCCTVVVIYIA